MSRNHPTKEWKELQKGIPANHRDLLAYEASRNAKQNEEREWKEKHVPPHARKRKKKH